MSQSSLFCCFCKLFKNIMASFPLFFFYVDLSFLSLLSLPCSILVPNPTAFEGKSPILECNFGWQVGFKNLYDSDCSILFQNLPHTHSLVDWAKPFPFSDSLFKLAIILSSEQTVTVLRYSSPSNAHCFCMHPPAQMLISCRSHNF